MLLEIVCSALGFICLLHVYISWNWNIWSKRNIPFITPKLFVGSMESNLFHLDRKVYNYFKGEKLGGYFEGSVPILWIQDLEIIKQIMTRDFDCFVDRRSFGLDDDPYLRSTLLGSRGQHWRDLRSFTTPIFSSGKLKRMISSVTICADDCVDYLKQFADTGSPVQMKDVFGRFVVDTIALTAYGLKVDSFKDPESKFLEMVENLVNPGKLHQAKLILLFLAPKLLKFIPLSAWPHQAVEFFTEITWSTIEQRESSGLRKLDFLQLISDAKVNTSSSSEEDDRNQSMQKLQNPKSKLELTEVEIVSQGLQIFFAGYETSVNLLTFAAYELALNQNVQEKLREEIVQVHNNHKNLDYECLKEMEYMDMVINEVQRLHPAVTRLDRQCTKDCKLIGTDFTVEKGMTVSVSTVGFNYDSDYYLDPETFNPQRFSKEEKAKRHPYLFLPFGTGPRSCIGMRFALMEMKLVLAKLLLNLKLVTCSKTEIPVQHENISGVNKPKGGVWLAVQTLK